MNAEQIIALIDTANKMTEKMAELASSMGAKCERLEKENKELILENKRLQSIASTVIAFGK